MDLEILIPAIAAIVGALWLIVKVVVGLTPTDKDDRVVKQVGPTVEKLVDAFDGEDSDSESK